MIGTALPKPPRGAGKRQRATSQRTQTKLDRAIYQHVTDRDPLCRACHIEPTTQRHHLLGRSITSEATVCGVCDDCHRLLHVRVGGKKLKIFGDAEKRSGWGMPCGLTVERHCGDRGWITWCER